MLKNKSMKFKIAYILGLGAVIVIALIGLYFVVKKKNIEKVPVSASQTPVANPIILPKSTTVISQNNTATASITASPKISFPFHYYDDKYTDLSKIHIIGVIFVIKDEGTIKDEWSKNGPDTLGEIKKFYERQFQNKSTIDFEWINEPLVALDSSKTLAPYQIGAETKERLKTREQDGSFNTYMIYIADNSNLTGNMGGWRGFATQGGFWLDNPSPVIDDNGTTTPDKNWGVIINSAHEFGHSIGLIHPWDMPENKGVNYDSLNSNTDIMAYGAKYGLTIEDMVVRDDMKKHLGL